MKVELLGTVSHKYNTKDGDRIEYGSVAHSVALMGKDSRIATVAIPDLIKDEIEIRTYLVRDLNAVAVANMDEAVALGLPGLVDWLREHTTAPSLS